MMSKSVSVLCRGKSLKSINILPESDKIVLVNSFQNELENTDIHNYVDKHDNIIHMVSPNSQFYPMVEKELYSKYNFKKIVLPYVEECRPKVIGLFLFKIKDKNGYILDVENMSDKNKDDMITTSRYAFTSPTCGMDSILYAVNDLEAKEVNIIGMDFYDGVGYFTNSHGEVEVSTEKCIERAKQDIGTANDMKSFFCNFAEKHSDVNFNVYTMADLKTDVKNIKVHRITEGVGSVT
jgi:hypothetical protein